MARIAGVDLPRQKRVEIALTYIYGIGVARSNTILGKAGIEPSVRVPSLSEITYTGSVGATFQFGSRGSVSTSSMPKYSA